MTSIRKIVDKKKVVETSIPGFYIKALTIIESKKLAEQHANIKPEDLKDDVKAQELTLSLFALACDENGQPFDEFATYTDIEQLSLEEFNMFAEAIKDALVPGNSATKK